MGVWSSLTRRVAHAAKGEEEEEHVEEVGPGRGRRKRGRGWTRSTVGSRGRVCHLVALVSLPFSSKHPTSRQHGCTVQRHACLVDDEAVAEQTLHVKEDHQTSDVLLEGEGGKGGAEGGETAEDRASTVGRVEREIHTCQSSSFEGPPSDRGEDSAQASQGACEEEGVVRHPFRSLTVGNEEGEDLERNQRDTGRDE
jgi:hypothetical protein